MKTVIQTAHPTRTKPETTPIASLRESDRESSSNRITPVFDVTHGLPPLLTVQMM
jgi:hypothetical protein